LIQPRIALIIEFNCNILILNHSALNANEEKLKDYSHLV
jgi:hypothetical protein